jgi:general secretion pathway protein B
MSFILDALKKSESDRQRQSGPALFEVKVAPPRTRLPLWAIAIALLLLVNLAIVAWMVLRRSAHEGAPASVPPAAATVAGATISAPPTAAAVPPAAASAPPPSAGAAAPPAAPAAAGGAEEQNPEDYAPAEEPPAPAPGSLGSRVRRGTASGVPLYQDAVTTPGTQLPQLRLDLHVYAARPQDRFVMINMHKLREGDSLPEGVHVESIVPEGAVLSYNGSRFLLPRE